MSQEQKELEKMIKGAIGGEGAHVAAKNVLVGLDWSMAGLRPAGFPHSILQLLNHMIYWQEWVVTWLDGADPAIPRHASGSWPGAEKPKSKRSWEDTVERFLRGLGQVEERCSGRNLLRMEGQKSRLEMLQTIALHNSYHIGQIVVLRRILGSWPPPSGGLTW